ncbi:2'-5' RNA ligase family protein [Streptomyces sp. 4.24]|uniref:2'-5' RNA ligase family protein n=1 Tax=Streptomyces tritrimontium TaxID=3406573 RepID=UPI003BB5C61E
MTDDTSSMFPAGRTALIVRIPEADPVVGAWRDRLDPAARTGVPAHVSVLYPFLEESRIDDSTLADLAAVLCPHPAFDLRFERTGRFPGLLYLAPEPDAPLRRLTLAVTGRWPEAPPYGGRHADPAPHLTVAQRAPAAAEDAAEADLAGRLPFTARVRSVELVAYDGTAWHERARFPLRAPGKGK